VPEAELGRAGGGFKGGSSSHRVLGRDADDDVALWNWLLQHHLLLSIYYNIMNIIGKTVRPSVAHETFFILDKGCYVVIIDPFQIFSPDHGSKESILCLVIY
jgi:hypothetical protein